MLARLDVTSLAEPREVRRARAAYICATVRPRARLGRGMSCNMLACMPGSREEGRCRPDGVVSVAGCPHFESEQRRRGAGAEDAMKTTVRLHMLPTAAELPVSSLFDLGLASRCEPGQSRPLKGSSGRGVNRLPAEPVCTVVVTGPLPVVLTVAVLGGAGRRCRAPRRRCAGAPRPPPTRCGSSRWVT